MLASGSAIAEPWLAPGDALLRHDLQILADRGIISGPVQTWPLSWGDIARDVLKASETAELTNAERAALARLKKRARAEARDQPLEPEARFALANEPRAVRGYAATPREEAEISAGVHWTGLRFSYRLSLTVVTDPDDGDELRGDGSYFGAVAGNWMFSAGLIDRWWGPAWDGGLILSTNARPVPAVSVNRGYSDPFPAPFRWLGPWTASVFMGQLEHDATIPDALLFGARIDIRPTQGLEIGLSRTAQWCGDGRPCDASTFFDLLVGNDNRGDDVTLEDEPGNQLAGGDIRWSAAGHGWPVALYGQLIGEDEASGMPSRFIGQVGAEVWGNAGWLDGSYRVHVEYADTAAGFYEDRPRFDYAYEHFIYKDGYRFKGRPIGHSLDNDSRMVSLGALLAQGGGRAWSVSLQMGELNRGGAVQNRNTVSSEPADLLDVEVGHRRLLGPGQIELTIGYGSVDPQRGGESEETARAFAQWYWMPGAAGGGR
jgi:hypothetical protein